MTSRARAARERTERKIRAKRLDETEKALLRQRAKYEGSPYHKRNPGDFGLTPPASPRRDATLCDEAGVFDRQTAGYLLEDAIAGGLVSDALALGVFPKQMWVVRGDLVFEAMHGGSVDGAYHGYPIRRSDPLFDVIMAAWAR